MPFIGTEILPIKGALAMVWNTPVLCVALLSLAFFRKPRAIWILQWVAHSRSEPAQKWNCPDTQGYPDTSTKEQLQSV